MANLTARQQRLYSSRVRIWADVPEYDENDVQTGTRWEMQSDQEPCWAEIAINSDETHIFGRQAYDSILTLDRFYLAVDAPVDADYILANQTLNLDGSPSANYGQFWRVKGPPRCFSSNRRHAGRKEVLAFREKTPPAGVSV